MVDLHNPRSDDGLLDGIVNLPIKDDRQLAHLPINVGVLDAQTCDQPHSTASKAHGGAGLVRGWERSLPPSDEDGRQVLDLPLPVARSTQRHGTWQC